MYKYRFPLDLIFIIIIVTIFNLFVRISSRSTTFIRKKIGFSLGLFLPGYVLLAAFFPTKTDLDEIKRIAFSFRQSIAVVPLIVLGLNYTSWEIMLPQILINLSVFIFTMCGTADFRRVKIMEFDAFGVPHSETGFSLKKEILEKPESKINKILKIFILQTIHLGKWNSDTERRSSYFNSSF